MITYLERQSARENSLGQSSSVDHECARKIVAIPSRILFLLSRPLPFFLSLSLSFFFLKRRYTFEEILESFSYLRNISFRLNGKFDSVSFLFFFRLGENFKNILKYFKIEIKVFRFF